MVAAFLVRDGTFVTTDGSAAVLAEAGGPDAIHRVTSRFYARLFVDKDLSNFVADPEEPHAERLGNWMVEKLGGAGTPWTLERAERAKCPVTRILGNGEPQLVHDRTSAHRAAWFSPRRPAEEMGRRFKLPECRVWMRLMFWSAREEGLLDKAPSFAQFFVQVRTIVSFC